MAAVTCTQHTTKSAPGTTVYRRRQPERSVAYQVMQGHLETWLAAGSRMRRIVRLPRTSSRISANISSVASWRMALPETDVPAAVTISLSPSPVKAAESVPLAIPGGWWRHLLIWLIKFFLKFRCVSGCCLFPSGCGIFWPVMLTCSIGYYRFFWTVWRRRGDRAVRMHRTLPGWER